MNILFIGGESDYIDANSVCIRNMAKELIKKGHAVSILAMGEGHKVRTGVLNGASLWEYPMDFFHRLTRLYNQPKRGLLISLFYNMVSLVRHCLLLFFYPNTSPIRAKRLSRFAFKIVQERHIDVVVCVFCPFDNIYSGLYLKRRLKNRIRVVSYHLDLRTGSASQSRLIRDYIHRHALESLVDEFNAVDRALIPYSGKKDIDSLNYPKTEKIKYVGFPVFVTEEVDEQVILPFEDGFLNIAYVGTLYPGNRDPQYFLTLCEKASKQIKLKVHFWGKMDPFIPLIDKYPFAQYHGTVDNDCVRYILNHSDFLLNIGNKLAFDMLPSKVFGMFATGKPIINIVTSPRDATVPYFLMYPNSININEYDKNQEDERQFMNFIRTRHSINPENLNSVFSDFRPETICEYLF